MNLIIITVFIGNLTITGYQSLAKDTDNSPYVTSTGERVSHDGVAVSQDLLKQNGGPLDYGDWLFIDGVGLKRIDDCMNKRHVRAIDIWCPNKKEEAKIFKKFKNGKTKVWVISRTRQETKFNELRSM